MLSAVRSVARQGRIRQESRKILIRTLCQNQQISITNHQALPIRIDPTTIYADPDRRPQELFPRADVQHLLRSLTRFDVDRIFKLKYVTELRSPKYQFMSDDELREAKKLAFDRVKSRVLMPPVLAASEDNTETIMDEPEIEGFETLPIIITDISLGFSDRTRTIVVREPNGHLRTANRDERSRMNHIWYPLRERQIETPQMFEEENLQPICDRNDHLLILDRACLQFEPDDPKYIQVTGYVYEHIRSTKQFDLLRSTRHFGPMAFYLAYHGHVDELLLDQLDREWIEESGQFVQLFLILSGRESEAKELLSTKPSSTQPDSGLADPSWYPLIEHYIETHSTSKHSLRVALNKHYDLVREREELRKTEKLAQGTS